MPPWAKSSRQRRHWRDGEGAGRPAALFITWRRPHGDPCRNQDAHRGLALEEEIPTGFAPDGLPVGVQILGRRAGAHTDCWAKQNGKWLAVSAHVTR